MKGSELLKKQSVIIDYTQGNITTQLLSFAVPFMLSALLQNLYSMVDTVVVGQFVGATGLSGVSIGSQVSNFITNFILGFASGGQVLISQYVGMKDRDGLRSTLGTMFTITGIFAVVMTVVCIAFHETILGLMHTPAEAFEQARAYLIICACGLIFICGYNAVCAVLRGSGDSKRPFVIIAATALTNLVLDLLFVAVFKMEAAGAALATVISQAVSAVIAAMILYRNRQEYDFDFSLKSLKINGNAFRLLMKQGIPLALKSSAISLSGLFVNSFINSYGLVASAAIAVGQKLQHLPSIVTMGLFNAGGAMVGQNIGAGKTDRISKIVKNIFVICLITFTVFGIVFMAFPYFFFGLFTTDPEVLAWAPQFMKVMLVGFVADTFMCPFYTVIIGIGFASFNLIISLFDGIVLRVGLGLLLGKVFGMGLIGFYLGSALAAFGTSVPSVIYYFSGHWKTYSAVKKKG